MVKKSDAILSVFIPVFNETQTVLLCLEKVLESHYVAEVIIVDDFSTDGTRELLLRISDERVKVLLHQKFFLLSQFYLWFLNDKYPERKKMVNKLFLIFEGVILILAGKAQNFCPK